ncbi:MAG: GIN domain-containing protein [Rectinemataceae bacterium]
MKRLFIPCAIALAALLSMGCAMFLTMGNGTIITEERLSGKTFDSVLSTGIFDVVAAEGPCSVSIEADGNLMSFITTSIRGTTLMLGIKEMSNIQPSKRITVTVSAPSFALFQSTGVGAITATGLAASPTLEVSLTGTGGATVGGTFASFELGITGTGSAKVTGTTDSLQVNITGTGSFNGFGLSTPSAHIDITGTGSARITMSGSTPGNLSGSLLGIGNIEYKGTIVNPSVARTGIGSLIDSN